MQNYIFLIRLFYIKMPNITVKLQEKDFRKAKIRAEHEGFKNPADWARFLIEQNMVLEESPVLESAKIISEMKKTGLYKENFLRDLKKSLEYADKTS